MTTIDDRMLSASESADELGMPYGRFLDRVRAGTAPAPDDPDEGRSKYRRNPRWRLTTIVAYKMRMSA